MEFINRAQGRKSEIFKGSSKDATPPPHPGRPSLKCHIRTYFVFRHFPFLHQFLGSFDQNQIKFLVEIKIYEVLNTKKDLVS